MLLTGSHSHEDTRMREGLGNQQEVQRAENKQEVTSEELVGAGAEAEATPCRLGAWDGKRKEVRIGLSLAKPHFIFCGELTGLREGKT